MVEPMPNLIEYGKPWTSSYNVDNDPLRDLALPKVDDIERSLLSEVEPSQFDWNRLEVSVTVDAIDSGNRSANAPAKSS
jgi:hypothetical protein